MEVLAAIKTPLAVNALIDLLVHANTDVVKYASVLLGQTGDKRAITPLVSLLNSPDSSIRYSAIRGLVGLKHSEIRSILIDHLEKETDQENQGLIESAL
jgi:HEAT repeat protein